MNNGNNKSIEAPQTLKKWQEEQKSLIDNRPNSNKISIMINSREKSGE